MKPWRRLTVLVCAVAALLALPAGAGAQSGVEVHPGSFALEVELPESQGWEMGLAAVNHRQIYLTAAKGMMAVAYRVDGRASSRRLEADFGPLGRIDIRLNLEPEPQIFTPPYARKGKKSRRCRGKAPLEMAGRFHGVVDFEGEENVVGVFARKGGVLVGRSFRTVCKRRPSKPPKGKAKGGPKIDVGINLLAARAHGGGRTTSVEALALEIESEVLFGLVSASAHERLGKVRIIRRAAGIVEGPELQFSPSGQKTALVKLKPTGPFAGHASYLKRAGSAATWTGNLRVLLPGTGEVPLAGPEFKAALCRGDGLEALDSLLRCASSVQTLADPGSATTQLRDLYGSGSHSQPLALARLSSLR